MNYYHILLDAQIRRKEHQSDDRAEHITDDILSEHKTRQRLHLKIRLRTK